MNVAVVPTTRVIGPSEEVREVDARGESRSDGHAVAALVEPEAPRQHAERVGAVHREEAAAVVGQRAELAARDQLGGVAHERRPAVVVADAADHAGAPRRRARARAVCSGVPPTGFSQKTSLPACRGRLDQLEVEHVRRGDRRRRRRPGRRPRAASRPVARSNPNAADRLVGDARRRIRADDQLGVVAAARRTASGSARASGCARGPSQPKPITPTPIRRRAAGGPPSRPGAAGRPRSRALQLALQLVRQLVELGAAGHHLRPARRG